MEIYIDLFSEDINNNECAWISSFTAKEKNKVLKEKFVADISPKMLIVETLKKILTNNTNPVFLNFNDNSMLEYLEKETFFKSYKNKDTTFLKKIDKYQEIKEFKRESFDKNIPSYVFEVPKDNYSKMLILFRIAVYFNEHPDKVFNFPLFLSLKPKLPKEWEVEDLLEESLEKAERAFSL